MAKLGKGLALKAGVATVLAATTFVGTGAVVLKSRGLLNKGGLSRLHGLPVVGGLFPKPEPKPAEEGETETAEAPKTPVTTPGGLRPMSAGEISRLMAEAERLRAEYQAKKDRLNQHEQRLELLAKDLDRKRQEIEIVKAKVTEDWRRLLQRQRELAKDQVVFEAAEQQNLKKLAKIYESMDGDQAALAMKGLDETTAVKLLFIMEEDKAGEILGGMDTEMAAQMCERMRRLRQGSSSDSPTARRSS